MRWGEIKVMFNLCCVTEQSGKDVQTETETIFRWSYRSLTDCENKKSCSWTNQKHKPCLNVNVTLVSAPPPSHLPACRAASLGSNGRLIEWSVCWCRGGWQIQALLQSLITFDGRSNAVWFNQQKVICRSWVNGQSVSLLPVGSPGASSQTTPAGSFHNRLIMMW